VIDSEPRPGHPPPRSNGPVAHPDHLARASWPGLAALLLLGLLVMAGFALHALQVTEGQGGVPLDDAWIHFQFARNVARGDGFAFNPGEPTAGSTAPLWTVLLAGLYAVGGRFPLSGQLLSGVCFLVSLVATYVLAKQITGRRWPAWLAGAVAAVNGRLVWAGLSGLETPLFAALGLLGISSHVQQNDGARYRLRTAALFGLAALTRPEGALLFALSAADFALRSPPRKEAHGSRSEPRASRLKHGVSHTASRLLPGIGVFAALVLPYVLFSWFTSGHPLPNTFSAKTTFDLRPDLAFLSLASQYLILDNPLLLPFFVLGIAASLDSTGRLGSSLRRSRILSAWAVGLPLIYAFLHATLYQHGRYLIPLIPCNAVIAVVGLLEAGRLALRRNWRWQGSRVALVILVTALVVGGTAWRLPTMGRLFAQDVENINQMHVAIGHWVAERTPAEAVLALNDIGAITYISQRRIVDLAGLVTPQVTPILRSEDRASRLVAFMAAQGVDYVIIFPNWFPGLAAREDLLEPLHRVTLERRTITGGRTMVVYRAHWRQ